MTKNEKTLPRVSQVASHVLKDAGASKAAKSLAGSALSQSKSGKNTSPAVASKAARALDDGRSSPSTKSLAGSVLTQKRK